MDKREYAERKIILGVKAVIWAITLFILEFLSLPVFGAIDKAQVNGQGFKTDFMLYTDTQPYPTIFLLTGIIFVIGIVMVVWGLKERK